MGGADTGASGEQESRFGAYPATFDFPDEDFRRIIRPLVWIIGAEVIMSILFALWYYLAT